MAGYYFRLPPIPQLTIPQQGAVQEPKQIALSGGPGTGKSVVSLWRHIRNYQSIPEKKSMLLTFTTTLKEYLVACCASVVDEEYPNAGKLSSRNVGTSIRNTELVHQNIFPELIIDEAQDLSEEYYTGIASPVSYGADDSQILYPNHCSTQNELQNLFPNNVLYTLDRNFRNSQRIMQFARTSFPLANIPIPIIQGLSDNVGEKPTLLIADTFAKKRDAIVRIIDSFRADDHNIAILVPWKDDAKAFEKNVMKAKNISYSIYYEDKNVFPKGCGKISNVHITTYKSAKGLEFDTVIIPNFDDIEKLPWYVKEQVNMDANDINEMENTISRLENLGREHNIIISKEATLDGRFNLLYEKLMCSWEDMYVACTRARSNLYLFSRKDFPELNSVTEKEIL